MDANSSENNNSNNMTTFTDKLLNMSTAADQLPFLLNMIVTNGKMASLGFVAIYVILVVLWCPFWLLTYLITETGVYVLMLACIFFLGRVVIRLLAFPGSSSRVAAEIETEFARYSVRMVQTAATCVIDLCSAILASSTPGGKAPHSLAYYDVPGLWSRTLSYRDRVLGMYLDVLTYLYRESPSSGATTDTSTTQYGNNRISGDIGNLMGLTAQARSDGKALMTLLKKVLAGLHGLEEEISLLLSSQATSPKSLSEEGRKMAKDLLTSTTELKDIVSSFKPTSTSDQDAENGDMEDDEDVTVEAVRRRLESENESALDAIKSAGAAIMALLDPPPHSSIFGLDMLRGSVLSRYKNAKQLWIPRPSGGNLDAMLIPATSSLEGRNRKALLYCNPNAGLIEVATGMSLAGGNVVQEGGSKSSHPCWADFYTQQGYDVFLFNYAGFGRSDGRHLCHLGSAANAPGVLGAFLRIFHFAFLTFKPSPQSLRDDARAVANHVILEAGYTSLVIHGESIGGLAAAGAARSLSQAPATKDHVSLLICDRTFCNLEATAQRLVGGWTGPAIRALAPLWNTDVAGDFCAAECPKVVANDAADSIISDVSSLKSGVSLSKELRRGVSTSRVGWKTEAPLVYRMADWENVGVNESNYAKPTLNRFQAPVWPTDKYISLQEAFHFAACVRRIGKVATAEQKRRTSSSNEEEGVEVLDGYGINEGSDTDSDVIPAWKALACCDGLCGTPLGFTVKNGFDCTVSWLCCTLTLGGQRVAGAAEKRLGLNSGPIVASDFESRHVRYKDEESEVAVHPKPIPEVIDALKHCVAGESVSMKSVEHEIHYTIGILDYVVARLSSTQSAEISRRSIEFKDSTGRFLELSCGHNNPFSEEEKQQLQSILIQASTPPQH